MILIKTPVGNSLPITKEKQLYDNEKEKLESKGRRRTRKHL